MRCKVMADEMRQDTTVTWNWFRLNIPTIVSVSLVGLWINNGIIENKKDTASMQLKLAEINGAMEPLKGLPYRVEMAEKGLSEANLRHEKLSNTLLNSVDLIRRDVNRLTTTVEVLNTQFGMFIGDEPAAPKQRRARPGGPMTEDQP